MYVLCLLLVLLHQSCISTLAAPLSASSSPGLLNADALNFEFPKNLSLHNQPNLGFLPTDPLARHIPKSIVTIIFRNYTIAISRDDSNRCVDQALGDALVHADRIYSKIEAPKEYPWGMVELSFIPGRTMRWVELPYAATSIEVWLKVYDAVDLNFDVVVNGVGVVGTGRLGTVF